jgi:phosphatidylserine/phosphatidylglycerophosphate/cardiolipin synthase-like enzyme
MRARLVSLAVALLLSPGLVHAQGELQLERLGAGLEGSAFFSPYDNLDQKVLAALDQARPGTTVYMSYYSLSFAEYPKMYKKLKDRGVTVRLNFYEGVALDPTYNIDDDLVRDGFDVSLIPNLRSPGGTASMHTKFTVVNDELVVTGSANLSASASLANHEHVVIVKNAKLAKVYIDEFEEQRTAAKAMRDAMTKDEWKDFHASKQFPDDWGQGRSRRLNDALRAIDAKAANGTGLVRTYFSPDDGCEQVALTELRKARKSIHVAMYSFTSRALAQELVRAAQRGVEVILVADDHQQSIGASEPINEILEAEPRVRFVRGNNHLGNYSSIHHKYAVVDGTVVLGGSFNWTAQANRYNDENLIVVKSKKLAARFTRDMGALLTAYDPSGALPAVSVPGDETRVLFAIAYSGEAPRGWELVVYGDAPGLGGGDPKRGVALRTSRSTAPNWLGSASLPRGQQVTFRLAMRKIGSITGTIEGGQGGVVPEAGDGHPLAVAPNGIPQLVTDKWKGPQPDLSGNATTNDAPLNNPNPTVPGGTPH